MQRKTPASGLRPQGTDGFDYSYRMTVDPRYTKVTIGKARLKIVILMQLLIQFLGIVYVLIFPPKAGVFNTLTVAAVSIGVVFCSIGELGRRHNKVNVLKLYCGLSSVAILFSVVVTGMHSFDLKSDKDSSQIQYNDVLGMKPVDLFFYGHVLLGSVVGIFQLHTTLNLVRNMAPPKRQ